MTSGVLDHKSVQETKEPRKEKNRIQKNTQYATNEIINK